MENIEQLLGINTAAPIFWAGVPVAYIKLETLTLGGEVKIRLMGRKRFFFVNANTLRN